MHRRGEKVRNKLGDFFFRLAILMEPEVDDIPESAPIPSAPTNVIPIGSAHHPSRGPR